MYSTQTIQNITPTLPDFLVGYLVGIQGRSELLSIEPFPPKSFLYNGEPYGWRISTDRWSIVVFPDSHMSVTWWGSYTDDEGNSTTREASPEALSELIAASVMPV